MFIAETGRFAVKALVHLATGLLARLPPAGARRVGLGLGWVLGSVVRYRRAEVDDRLASCFPDRSDRDRRRLADAAYSHLGMTVAEASLLLHGRAEPMLASALIPDLSPIRSALDRGRGLLILGGHLGNWELLAVLAGRHGFPATVLVKAIRKEAMNQYVTHMRTRYGIKLLPQRGAYRQCLRVLKANGILSFVLDQNMTRDEGIFVDFFGRPACTSPGLAHLSAHAGAPVLPACCIRRPDGRFEVELGDVMDPPTGRDPDSVREATQQYTRVLEEMIRQHPDQWTWIHRRWRTRPFVYTEQGDGSRDGGGPHEKGMQTPAGIATVDPRDRRGSDE